MEEIINPVAKELLKAELTEDKFLRTTNVGGNSIYLITAHDSPNVMLEIGRLRELTFREAGGGTGFEVDIDEYDYLFDSTKFEKTFGMKATSIEQAVRETVAYFKSHPKSVG